MAERTPQSRTRGQPLLFLGTVLLLWTVARIIHHLPDGGISVAPVPVAQKGGVNQASPSVAALVRAPVAPVLGTMAMLGIAVAGPAPPIVDGAAEKSDTFDIAMAHQMMWMESLTTTSGSVGSTRSPLVDGPLMIEPQGSTPKTGASSAPVTPSVSHARWSIYGWSLLRQAARSRALAPGAQYGGSQAGLILRFDLGKTGTTPALYARAATALANDDDQTLAIGFMARPWASLPVDLAVERRFGLADGQRDRFAAMLTAGGGASLGRSPIRVEGYGQAGIVGWSEPQGFFDLQMLASRQMEIGDDHAVSVGGGVWAGGQQEPDAQGDKSWVYRVDIGPRAAFALPVGDARMTVALDWRQRVDGNALPASGAAITVSAGF